MDSMGVVLEPSLLKVNSDSHDYKLDIRVINTSPKSRTISIHKPANSQVCFVGKNVYQIKYWFIKYNCLILQ